MPITARNFSLYARLIGRKWILWLILAIDGIALVTQFLFPRLSLPQPVYVIALLTGFFWAGFQVYQDTAALIPSHETKPPLKVQIELAEGSQYSYTFKDIEKVSKPDARHESEAFINSPLPDTILVLNGRIQNTGLGAIDLLSAGAFIDFHTPYSFMLGHPVEPDGSAPSFPINMQPGSVLHLKIALLIFPYSTLTPAQIASRTRQLIREQAFAGGTLAVEAADIAGNRQSFRTAIKVALRPLCDLYVAHWRSQAWLDLERLATGIDIGASAQ